MYKVITGIKPLECGFKRIKIEVRPGGTLTWAKAKLNTPYGELVSNWEIKDSKFLLYVKIPSNTQAEIIMPDGQIFNKGSGEYDFQIDYFSEKTA